MAKFTTLSIQVDTAGLVASLTSVMDVFLASRRAVETFTDRFPGVFESDGLGGFDLSDEGLGLLMRECIDMPALRACELVSVQFNPSDAFLEAVAAIASDCNAHVVFRHGWPILSLGSDIPSMAEAAGASSSSRGGAA